MMKSKKNKKNGNTPLTLTAILQGIGFTVIAIILLIGIAERLWHYFHYHLTK